MNLTFYTRNVYGSNLVYLSDWNQRRIIAKLTNSTATLSKMQIEGLKELGCTFEEVKDPSSIRVT